MLVLAPSTSLTLPSGRAKPLVRGEGDGNPAACPRRRLASWGQRPSGLLPGKVQSFPFPVTRFSFPGAGRETEFFGDSEKFV